MVLNIRPAAPLKILHVFRAPLGGLFRHVVDLVRGQVARGHRVGLVADSRTGGARADEMLASLAPHLEFGISRLAMHRHLGLTDVPAVLQVSRRIACADPDVVHGHGAKGAAYGRLAAPGHRSIRAYTPHGGTLLYRPGTLASRFYVMLERVLAPYTDLFLFESAYARDVYRAKVGAPQGLVRVVHNGIGPEEFVDVAPNADAADIVFIGELRPVKGVDVLLDAIARLRQKGEAVSAVVVGSGPERAALEAQAQRLGLGTCVRFCGPMPAREAFALGRLMVIPSRAESLPYIVLEAAAAGIPLVTTSVGGVPEIFGPLAKALLPAGDCAALADAIVTTRREPEAQRALTKVLQDYVRAEFSVEAMVDDVLAAYREALMAREHAVR
jgi:glycosyltransferase involved in cell wall biosynthesis